MIAKAVRGYDVIALSPEDWIDSYARWFKVYGLFDYVDDILPPQRILVHIEIEGGGRLTAHNLHTVLSAL